MPVEFTRGGSVVPDREATARRWRAYAQACRDEAVRSLATVRPPCEAARRAASMEKIARWADRGALVVEALHARIGVVNVGLML